MTDRYGAIVIGACIGCETGPDALRTRMPTIEPCGFSVVE
jgi:hypothetical protein